MALAEKEGRPGVARRAALRDRAREKMENDVPRRRTWKSVKIDRYYDIAETLLDRFDDAFDKKKLDDSYVLAKRFLYICLEELPKHGDYNSHRYETERYENRKDVDYILDKLELISDLIDEEEETANGHRSKAEIETERRIRTRLERRNSTRSMSSQKSSPSRDVARVMRRASDVPGMVHHSSARCLNSSARRASMDNPGRVHVSSRRLDNDGKEKLESWSNHERVESERRRSIDRRGSQERMGSFRGKKSSLDRHSSHELQQHCCHTRKLNASRRDAPEERNEPLGYGSSHDRYRETRSSRTKTSLDHDVRNCFDQNSSGHERGRVRDPQRKSKEEQRREPDRQINHEHLRTRKEYGDQTAKGLGAMNRKSKSFRNQKVNETDEVSQKSQGTWVGKELDLHIKRSLPNNQGTSTNQNTRHSSTDGNGDDGVRVYGYDPPTPAHEVREQNMCDGRRNSSGPGDEHFQMPSKYATMNGVEEGLALVSFQDPDAPQRGIPVPTSTTNSKAEIPAEAKDDDASISMASILSYPSID